MEGQYEEERGRSLIDSGVTYTLFPERSVGSSISPQAGTLRVGGWAHGHTVGLRTLYRLPPGGEAHPCDLDDLGDKEARLGVVILQILGLVFAPFTRTLEPMRMSLV